MTINAAPHVAFNAAPRPDPNTKQQAASNPFESIWVGASAGTGKTKVLTDRVLRLLLPRNDGHEGISPEALKGTPAHRILCLTFTKAAANEMAMRINRTLGDWAVMERSKLIAVLHKLLGTEPQENQIKAAQQLFAQVIDTAGGLQIMTIHSFCQSVLGRFPLEADLPPNFTLLDDAQSRDLIRRVQADVLAFAGLPQSAGSPLGDALHRVAAQIDEKSFLDIIKNICSERHQFKGILTSLGGVEGVYAALCAFYHIPQGMGEDDVIAYVCADGAYDAEGLTRAGAAMLEEGGKTSVQFGSIIAHWLKLSHAQRIENFTAYKNVFIKKDGEARVQNFPVKGVIKIFPQAQEVLQEEAARLITAANQMKSIKSAALTRDILYLGAEILSAYAAIKQQKGSLDFDDLILRTMALLRGETDALHGFERVAPWIMYKLDQGLDHILIDEAQDTNPEQWKIIEAICGEFFDGAGARDQVLRTSFTVGDVKQSIYSFQRAAPQEFQRMQGVFDKKIKNAGLQNRSIDLDISFRSTRSILQVVDRVFAAPQANKAVGGGEIHHISHRAGQAGRVELWPLFETPQKEKVDFWSAPTEIKGQKSGAAQLADYIALKIDSWIGKERLESKGRSIQAGDIMILVRTRTAFVDQLVRALKLKSISVSGVDRMMLDSQLVVQDMLALARFVALPQDDLNLACVLKSPFVGMDEDALFTLAHGRSKSLWDMLMLLSRSARSDSKYLAAAQYLLDMLQTGKQMGAYEFFMNLLQRPCPADDISGMRAVRGRLGEDALDPVDELLNAALLFSRTHVDTLQLFLAHQDENDVEIKRELEEGGGKVRIMTIHGSKGLQAPVVIMPDTIITGQARKIGRFLWPHMTGLPFPLWSAREEDAPDRYSAIYGDAAQKAQEELYRLLYVAMTRAADRLYVGGFLSARAKPKEESWYHQIRSAMAQDQAVQEAQDGTLFIENLQESHPDKADLQIQARGGQASDLPRWLHLQAPQEASRPRLLKPSQLDVTAGENNQAADVQEPAALSPLEAGRAHRFVRGNMTHKLLQFLPDLDPEARQAAAQHFVQKNARNLPQDVQGEIVREVMAILNNPDFAPFFEKNSLAEVPITGFTKDGQILSAQIDRLVIGAQDIWILDYKTNRPPPLDARDIPEAYRRQLKAYRDVVRLIYPTHKIHCALLWTDGARLMILDNL